MKAVRFLLAAVAALLGYAQPAAADDLSAETLAIVHDLMAPYRGGTPALGGTDPAAVQQALEILNKERLLDFNRPGLPSLNLASKLGRALAMGSRTQQFLPEIAAVRDAVAHQREDDARKAIQALYAKMGRKPPEGAALEPLLAAVQEVVGNEPAVTEQTTIERPDYTILIENARSAGLARVAVLEKAGPEGEPARVEFKGEVTSQPDRSGKDLELAVRPANSPETMTTAQAAALRQKLTGPWQDQDGNIWELSGDGGAIALTEQRPGKTLRVYRGTFDLGLIRAAFTISKPDDMGEDLPLKVRQQLASMNLSFRVSLSAVEGGNKLDGTWSSQHVTYDDSTEEVERVHDPFDVALVLTPLVTVSEGTGSGAGAKEQP
ncbi:MAG: hypothetical protein ACOY3L_14885 [Pseudomonadota bacterium]